MPLLSFTSRFAVVVGAISLSVIAPAGSGDGSAMAWAQMKRSPVAAANSPYIQNLGAVEAPLRTAGECQRIRAMMKKRPGLPAYALIYTNADGDVVNLTVLIKMATITRRVQPSFGDIQIQIWRGDIAGRLRRGVAKSPASLGSDFERKRG